MDYEKKYKEAIERLKQWDREHPDGYSIQERDEFIFPELKESEDEKIEKELIDYLKERKSCESYGQYIVRYNRWIAWLEKQGEQKATVPKFKIGQTIKKEGFNIGFTIAKIENGFYYDTTGSNFPINDEKNWKLVEQKPVEWSEEDEEMIDSIIGNIKYLYSIGSCDNATVDKKVNWLKSLSPHNTWKPSDEHYELEEFAKIVRSNLTGISKAVQKLFEAKYLQLTGNKMYGGFKD